MNNSKDIKSKSNWAKYFFKKTSPYVHDIYDKKNLRTEKIYKYYEISGDGIAQIKLPDAIESRRFQKAVKALSDFDIKTKQEKPATPPDQEQRAPA